MKLDHPNLSAHHWLVDAVREGLNALRVSELASFPIEAADGSLERLLIATDRGLVEGVASGAMVEGMPGLTLDLALWRDVRVSARARVDPQHGAHTALGSVTVNGRTVSSFALHTREAATEFIAEVLAQASGISSR